MSNSFQKKNRLLHSGQFRFIGRHGVRHVGKFLVIQKMIDADSANVKLGLTVSRHFGKAHERNRFKRMTREAFRLLLPRLDTGLLLNIKPRYFAKKAKMQDLQKELESILIDFS